MDLRQQIIIRSSRMERERLRKERDEAFLKLVIPLIREIQALAEKAGEAVQISAEHFEKFHTEHEFYPYEQHAPSFLIYMTLARWLSKYVNDAQLKKAGLRLDKWEDEGPSSIRHLFTGKNHFYDGPSPDEQEYQAANIAYRQLLKDLDSDCIPLHKSILQLAIHTYEAGLQRRVLIESIAKEDPHAEYYQGPFPDGMVGVLVHACSQYPEQRELLKKSLGDQVGLFVRVGAPHAPAASPLELRRRMPDRVRLELLEKQVYGE